MEMAKQFVAEANRGLSKQLPKLIENGDGGAYLVKDSDGNPFGVFKPTDEDPSSNSNPKSKKDESPAIQVNSRSIPSGQCSIREVAAHKLDRNQVGVPLTMEVEMYCKGKKKTGSIQKFADHDSSSWDISPGHFSITDVHQLGIFDLRICNTDRHGGNILVKKKPNSDEYKLIPIDHAYAFPTELGHLAVDWIYWDQARKPFSEESLKFIEEIDIDDDMEVLKNAGLDEKSMIVCKSSTIALKLCARKGWSLYKIARLSKRIRKKPSGIEKAIANVEKELGRTVNGVKDEKFWKCFRNVIEKL